MERKSPTRLADSRTSRRRPSAARRGPRSPGWRWRWPWRRAPQGAGPPGPRHEPETRRGRHTLFGLRKDYTPVLADFSLHLHKKWGLSLEKSRTTRHLPAERAFASLGDWQDNHCCPWLPTMISGSAGSFEKNIDILFRVFLRVFFILGAGEAAEPPEGWSPLGAGLSAEGVPGKGQPAGAGGRRPSDAYGLWHKWVAC